MKLSCFLLCVVFALSVTFANAQESPDLSPAQRDRALNLIIDHNSFSPPILRDTFSGTTGDTWKAVGATVITDHYVRLTPDEGQQVGQLWNMQPLELPDFEIVLGLSIRKKSNGADGIALWVAEQPEKRLAPPHAQLLGNTYRFKGFGILLDIYDNDGLRDNPTVGLLLNDNTKTRFNAQKDFHDDYTKSCSFDFRSASPKHIATMRVHLKADTLSVYLSRNQEKNEVLCFTYPGVHLTIPEDKYYIGLTGETGGMYQEQDVVFLHTTPLGDEPRVQPAVMDLYDMDEEPTPTPAKRGQKKKVVPVEEEEEDDEEEEEEEEVTQPPKKKKKKTTTTTTTTTTSTTTSSTAPPAPVQDDRVKKLEEELAELRRQTKSKKKIEREEVDEEEEDDDDEEEEPVPRRRRRTKRRNTRRG